VETAKLAEDAQKAADAAALSGAAQRAERVNGPIAGFSPHSSGWTVDFSFADPPLAISWRMGDVGEFRETGLLNEFDPLTRKRRPRSQVQLARDTPAGILQVRYVDSAGVPRGPFPIRFDPFAALIKWQRENLERSTGWLLFDPSYGMRFNTVSLNYSRLVESRCAIREARLGIDRMEPDRVLELPPCDLRNPSGIPSHSEVSMKLPLKTQLVSVKLIYQDGSSSELKTLRREAASKRE